MAIIVKSHIFITFYAENKLVRMPWPKCDRVESVCSVYRPRGLVYTDNLLYVACYGNPIGRVVVVGSDDMVVRRSFIAFRPRGIALWNHLILVSEVNRGRVAAYKPSGRVVHVWGGFSEPRDISVNGDNMYVADTGNNRVVRVELPTSSYSDVLQTQRPNGVASNGTIVVSTDWNSGVVKIVNSNNDSYRCVNAHTPAMVSYARGNFIVCDVIGQCLLVLPVMM